MRQRTILSIFGFLTVLAVAVLAASQLLQDRDLGPDVAPVEAEAELPAAGDVAKKPLRRAIQNQAPVVPLEDTPLHAEPPDPKRRLLDGPLGTRQATQLRLRPAGGGQARAVSAKIVGAVSPVAVRPANGDALPSVGQSVQVVPVDTGAPSPAE